MEVSKWSQDELKEEFANCKTVSEVIGAIEESFERKGHVLCEITINGMVFHDDDEIKFGQNSMNEIKDLEIKTSQPTMLIGEAKESAIAYLDRVKESAINCSELFREGNEQDGYEVLCDIIDAIQWSMETLKQIRRVAMSIPDAGDDSAVISEWETASKTLFSVSSQLLQCFEANDVVLLADLLEYDLSNIIEKWQGLLSNKATSMAS
jgi:hypothetical protein